MGKNFILINITKTFLTEVVTEVVTGQNRSIFKKSVANITFSKNEKVRN